VSSESTNPSYVIPEVRFLILDPWIKVTLPWREKGPDFYYPLLAAIESQVDWERRKFPAMA